MVIRLSQVFVVEGDVLVIDVAEIDNNFENVDVLYPKLIWSLSNCVPVPPVTT